MESSVFYIDPIKKRYPHLPIETVALNQEGQYNDALVINNKLVFRFAKVPYAVGTLQRELSVLQGLQNRLTLPIPDPIYHSQPDASLGEAFLGYCLIPGRGFSDSDLLAISSTQARVQVAGQIAGFLYELHHIPAREAFLREIPTGDQHNDWQTMFDRIRTKLYEFMRPNAQEWATRHFEEYLHHPARYAFEPCLRHGDFGCENILYDPESTCVAGVIDFGDCQPGDPAVDFAGLLASYGMEFYELCATNYPEMATCLYRVRFYQGTFALQEALFGIENGDLQAFHAGIEEYI